MAGYQNFQVNRNKRNDITNIYDPDGNSFEKSDNEERLSRMEQFRETFVQYASLWRQYPDLFVDTVTPPDSGFNLFFYQRLFLRVAMRYRYMYATFTRAFSKSFLSVLTLYLKCIMYPRTKLFICSGGKEQAANIAKEKIEDLWEKFPILRNEIKDHSFTKDYVRLIFHNGSKLDIVAVENSSRGGRRNGGLMEEVILIDGQKLNEVILPLMNVDRRVNGEVDPDEPHKSQIYVTTAGYKNTFSYQKMVQLLIWMVLKGNAFVFGGDWRIPVMHGLLNEDFVEELKEDGTYNESSFEREYESKWSGSSDDAFFSSDLIDRHRTVIGAEHEPDVKNKKAEYIISADVARRANEQNADTAVIVFKVTPRPNGTYDKRVVNIQILHGTHFLEQSINLKRLVFHYNAKMLVLDSNGLGVGLVDYIIKPNVDEKTGEEFPPFSVVNDDEYDKYKTSESLPLLYNIKAMANNNSQIHVNCLSQISSGRVKFLVDDMTARARLLSTKEGQMMGSEEVTHHVLPFLMTSIMKEQMLNLRQKQEGKNLKLEQINKRVNKDIFSALEYGLWYLKSLEDKNSRKKKDVEVKNMFFARAPKIR